MGFTQARALLVYLEPLAVVEVWASGILNCPLVYSNTITPLKQDI
jgi:hypothetical protein